MLSLFLWTLSLFLSSFFCFFSASSPLCPMHYFPLRKVKWLTVALSKLAYSEVSKTALWVYWEKAWSDPLREERQLEEKGETNKRTKTKHCRGSCETENRPQQSKNKKNVLVFEKIWLSYICQNISISVTPKHWKKYFSVRKWNKPQAGAKLHGI